MGLFYAAPGNLNNDVGNFNLNQDLNYDTGLYKYPDGTSQLFLSQCVVTGVVGTDGVLRSDPGSDSLVGARVTSPGPDTQKPEGKEGLYGFAKMVDLDPNMQFRTELYGFRIYVDLEGGGGFSGELAKPPQLRDLWFGRGNGNIFKDGEQVENGLQIAVGTWHQRLTNLTWTDPPERKGSPVYDALHARSSAELDVKLGVDMFQTWRANEFKQGDRFGYGRLVGAIGRAKPDEPTQLVPGRRLYTPRTFETQLSAAEPGPARLAFTRQAAEEAMSGAEPSFDWNRTDLRVCDDGSMLIVDLFNSAPLAILGEGKFETGGNVVVGWLDATSLKFTPLKNGAISFTYSKPAADTPTGKLKDVFWPDHAAIFQVELTGDERKTISNKPLAIQAGGTTVVRENSNGVYLNIERPSTRMEPNKEDDFDVFSYQYGELSTALPTGLTFQRELNNDGAGKDDPPTFPTKIFSAAFDPSPVSRGRFRLHVKTGPAVPLTEVRKPLDSFLCFLTATGTGYLVGEAMTLKPRTGPPTPPFLSLIFWQNHNVVDQPDWDLKIQPLMAMYARLFPGMVSILDISNFKTVKANAAVLKNRFERLRTDPGFMPVSRDMSPATVDMVVRFLDRLIKEQP